MDTRELRDGAWLVREYDPGRTIYHRGVAVGDTGGERYRIPREGDQDKDLVRLPIGREVGVWGPAGFSPPDPYRGPNLEQQIENTGDYRHARHSEWREKFASLLRGRFERELAAVEYSMAAMEAYGVHPIRATRIGSPYDPSVYPYQRVTQILKDLAREKAL